MQFSFFSYIGCTVVLLFGCLPLWAEGVEPELAGISPVAVLLSENGTLPAEPVRLYPGDSYTGAAPLEFRFQVKDSGTPPLRYEWSFARDAAFHDVFLTRFDEETLYCFQESGACYVRLLATDAETGNTYTSEPFLFRVAESELKVPNAFSPNGDGVNDVFKVTHKSLIRFRAFIFNRWGQELYRWGLDNIDAGWEGTTHGKPVAEGVYFIVVEAEGADGIRYQIKGDINILR